MVDRTAQEASLNRLYDWIAPVYLAAERLASRALLGIDLRREQAAIVGALGIARGAAVLEVSPGAGAWQPALARAVGPDGRLTALDLSRGMLRACARNTARQVPQPRLVRGTGAALPFPDAGFDALFHFGGIRLFADADRALAEFVRVVRPGGLIAVGDEGFGPGVDRRRWRARILARANPGFLRPEPALPGGASVLARRWVYADHAFFWVLRRDG